MSLDDFLAPIDPGTFFEEHWEKKTLHVPGPAAKWASVGLDAASFWATVDALPPDATCLRAIYHDQSGEHQEILVVPPPLAEQRWQSGMTIVFNHLEDHHAGVRALIDSLRADLDLAGQITCASFYSPREHGAKLHYDNHSALVVQLVGKKRWRYSPEPALPFPPRNYGYKSDAELAERSPLLATSAPDRDSFLESELEPGHLLYLPPGTWHEPREFGGEGSLHVTLGPFPKTSLQLVQEQLARGLGERLAWRRTVPSGPRGLLHVERFFEERLAELRAYVNDLRASDLARLWHAQVAPPARAVLADREPVAPRDRLVVDRTRRVSLLRARDDSGEEKIFVYLDGEEIDLPASASAFAETLVAKESFVAEEARGWVSLGEEPYDWEDVAAILDVFRTRGLLRR